MKNIISGVCVLLVVLMLVLTATLFVRRTQNKVTFLFGSASVWILSPSMEPTIPERTYIRIERIEPSDIAVGDVITFYSDDPTIRDQLNTHRVVGIVGDHEAFVTKGDRNIGNDKYTVGADRVVGIWRENQPKLTAFMRFFLTPVGFAVIIGAVLLLTLAACLPDFKKHIAKKKADAEAAKKAEEERLLAEELERLEAAGRALPNEPENKSRDGE